VVHPCSVLAASSFEFSETLPAGSSVKSFTRSSDTIRRRDNNRLQRIGFTVPLIGNLPLMQLSLATEARR
jgi:hypothetical protein